MHKRIVFLLAVIACSNLVSSVEGRQLKSVSKIDDSNHAMHKEDHYIPNAAHHSVSESGKKVLPPPMPTKGSDFDDHDSVAGHTDAFRPTTPGNSPGAGHSSVGDDEEIERTAAGAKANFRPAATNPGHSPGVGHAFPSKNSKPNA